MTIRVVFGEDSYLAREAILTVLEEEDRHRRRRDVQRLRLAPVSPAATSAPTWCWRTSACRRRTLRGHPARRRAPEDATGRRRGDPQPVRRAVFATKLLGASSDRRAYLLKERVQGRGDLTRALREVAAGHSIADPQIVESLVAAKLRREESQFGTLTPREQEILAWSQRA